MIKILGYNNMSYKTPWAINTRNLREEKYMIFINEAILHNHVTKVLLERIKIENIPSLAQ